METKDSPIGMFQCDDCGGNITPFGVLIMDSGKHYCSVTCYENPSRVCNHCGNALSATQDGFLSPVTKKWYCNPRCHYAWHLKNRHI